ncbi:hypothetical protein G7046_g1314 [Stylonectria norvegica]|nr:hypothetical protein G7046_g1314 [Stylonectria norvegica]
MASLAKSQNVCTGCRSRKRKCDGQRPSCSSCLKRGDACVFIGAPSRKSDASIPIDLPLSSGWDDNFQILGSFPSYDMNQNGINIQVGDWPPSFESNQVGDTAYVDEFRQDLSMETLSSSQTMLPVMHEPALHTRSSSLPPTELLLELVELYFEKSYDYLPILHKQTILSRVNSLNQNDCPLLFLAIISVAAGSHPDRRIQGRQRGWLAEATASFSNTVNTEDHPLQTLQVASFIIFQAMIYGQFPTAWMVLGEAWRKAAAMGCNTQDCGAERILMPGLGPLPSKDWIEKEESRRAVWMLFVFDRGLSFPMGLTHAIDDRKLGVNLPMSEAAFQSTSEPANQDSPRYTSNLDRLITSVQERTRRGSASLWQYIVLAYAFLGRVSDCIYSLDWDPEEQKAQVEALTSNLLRIRLMLPRSATDLSAADYLDFTHVVWLNVTLNSTTVLLYHRPLDDGKTLEDPSDLATNWPHCVSAARNTISMIRDAARTSTSVIVNPHLGSSLFNIGRIVVIEYMCPSTSRRNAVGYSNNELTRERDPALVKDMEVLISTFEIMKDGLKACGKKFRNGLLFFVGEGEAEVREAKAGGSRALLKTCAKWPKPDPDT